VSIKGTTVAGAGGEEEDNSLRIEPSGAEKQRVD
jgi:hypothetical protein